MKNKEIIMLNSLGNIDIYLLDQLIKGRILPNSRILDAGCGYGRNAEYFIRNNFDIWGIDKDPFAVETMRTNSRLWNPSYDENKFQIADLCNIPFPDAHFDCVLSSAVLHFAANRAQFIQFFEELIRVLQPKGLLWLRMTTKHTIEAVAQHLYDDVYALPDGSTRYLLDKTVLQALMEKRQLYFLDPFKTINVADLRTMATVVLVKGK